MRILKKDLIFSSFLSLFLIKIFLKKKKMDRQSSTTVAPQSEDVIKRIKRLAMFQTVCLMSAVCVIIILTAIVTRAQHHSDDSLPVSMKQVLRGKANIAALNGLHILKLERQTPRADRINRIAQISKSVGALDAIRGITDDRQFEKMAGGKTDLRKVLGELQTTLNHWSVGQ